MRPLNPKGTKGKQEDLDKRLEKLLAEAKRLLNSEGKKRDRPEFPDAPFNADEKETKVPPREEDSDEPLPGKKKGSEKKGGKSGKTDPKDKKEDEDEENEKFMPRLPS